MVINSLFTLSMKPNSLSYSVCAPFIERSMFCRTLLLASCLLGLVVFSGCDKAAVKSEKQYKALKIQDTGNRVRNYWLAFTAYNDVLDRKTANQTPQERSRDQAMQDSIRRLPSTPERRNQLAQLRGFESAQQEDSLQRKAHNAYLAAVKSNPAFFQKSWRQRMKWLLLAQANETNATPSSSRY